MSGQPIVSCVGTFRSGTNLAKFLLEKKFYVDVRFNDSWWKHGCAPTLVREGSHFEGNYPLVVMFKDPVKHNRSIYEFWRKTRPYLISSSTFSDFIRERLVVHDNSFGGGGPKYRFCNPTEYWNSYYFSYLTWTHIHAKTVFVSLDELSSRTDEVLEELGVRLGLRNRQGADVAIPHRDVLPSSDVSGQLGFGEVRRERVEMDESDIRFIASQVDDEVYNALYDVRRVSAVDVR